MFWSDWGRSPRIERAGMDGSHRLAISFHGNSVGQILIRLNYIAKRGKMLLKGLLKLINVMKKVLVVYLYHCNGMKYKLLCMRVRGLKEM